MVSLLSSHRKPDGVYHISLIQRITGYHHSNAMTSKAHSYRLDVHCSLIAGSASRVSGRTHSNVWRWSWTETFLWCAGPVRMSFSSGGHLQLMVYRYTRYNIDTTRHTDLRYAPAAVRNNFLSSRIPSINLDPSGVHPYNNYSVRWHACTNNLLSDYHSIRGFPGLQPGNALSKIQTRFSFLKWPLTNTHSWLLNLYYTRCNLHIFLVTTVM